MEGATLYILRCADGSYHTGLTRRSVDERVSEHQNGCSAYTKRRRPVVVIHAEHYPVITAERRIKGWSRTRRRRTWAVTSARRRRNGRRACAKLSRLAGV